MSQGCWANDRQADTEAISVPLIGGLKGMELTLIHEVIRRCRGNKAAAAPHTKTASTDTLPALGGIALWPHPASPTSNTNPAIRSYISDRKVSEWRAEQGSRAIRVFRVSADALCSLLRLPR